MAAVASADTNICMLLWDVYAVLLGAVTVGFTHSNLSAMPISCLIDHAPVRSKRHSRRGLWEGFDVFLPFMCHPRLLT
jgi:hypothetical protein